MKIYEVFYSSVDPIAALKYAIKKHVGKKCTGGFYWKQYLCLEFSEVAQ